MSYSSEKDGITVTAIDALTWLHDALQKHDASANTKVFTEPLYKLHSTRLKIACRILEDPDVLRDELGDRAQELLALLSKTQMDPSHGRKKLYWYKKQDLQQSQSPLAFADARVNALLEQAPESHAGIFKQLVPVLSNAVLAMHMCKAEFKDHPKALSTLIRFYSAGPQIFREPKLALDNLMEAFVFDPNKTKFCSLFLEDIDKTEIPRPGSTFAIKVRLASLLCSHFERNEQLELLALVIPRIGSMAPALMEGKPIAPTDIPIDLVLKSTVTNAIVALQARFSAMQNKREYEDVFQKVFFIRRAASFVVKIIGQDLLSRLDQLLVDAWASLLSQKERPNAPKTPQDVEVAAVRRFSLLLTPNTALVAYIPKNDAPPRKKGGRPQALQAKAAAAAATPSTAATPVVAAPNLTATEAETPPVTSASAQPDAAAATSPTPSKRIRRQRKQYQKSRESARTRAKNNGTTQASGDESNTNNPDAPENADTPGQHSESAAEAGGEESDGVDSANLAM